MFTQNPTPRQINFIAGLFKPDNSETIKALYERTPRNNKKYPDTRADYRNLILTDTIQEQFTSVQASLFIKCIQNAIPHSQKKLVELFNQLKF